MYMCMYTPASCPSTEPLHDPNDGIPLPLRQHVARRRLDIGDYPPVGTQWEEDGAGGTAFLAPSTAPSSALVAAVRRILAGDGCEWMTDDLLAEVTLATVVDVDGRSYRPVDTSHFLTRHARHPEGRRWVSAALKHEQSKQLLTAFYYVTVDAKTPPDVHHALLLVMYHYMKERGYTARWIGKYDQLARHIGNGDAFRTFGRLQVYAPHRLPAAVLNVLCGADGKLHSRGSKGTRSKYLSARRRYVPSRRLTRSRRDELRMQGKEEDDE